jgi:hypothetical protein
LEVGHELGAVALKTAIAGSAATTATSYFLGFWNTMRIGLSVASWFVPWLKVVTIGLAAVSVATYAYSAADEYLNGELSNSIFAFTETKAAISDVGAAFSEAGAALGIAGDGIGSVSAQIAKSILYWTGVESAINAVDSAVAAVVSTGAQAIRDWSLGVQILSDGFSDMVSPAGASAAALRDMAAASEELIAKQEAMRPLFASLAAMQEGAAAQAEHNAEIQRIAGIASVDAINLEINALQQKAAAEILAGEATEESQKKTAALFGALENQRKKIESGGMEKKDAGKSAGQSSIEQAEQELRRLTMGQQEAAISAAIMAGATAEETERLRELQAEIAGVAAEQKAREEAEKAAKDAANEQQRLYEQAESQIGNMVDQIDLMTGAATKADIAFRNALKDGFTREQANEIKSLADETARLEKEESRRQKFSQKTTLKAAMQGSQEAASIMIRGVGPKTLESLAQKSLQVQQQTLIAIKNNKPGALTASTLGVA